MKTAVADKSVVYRDVFAAGQATEPAWARYSEQRQQALERLLAGGLVTRGQEDWVFGTAGGLVAGEAVPVQGVVASGIAPAVPDGSDSHLLVFVNGLYAPELSRLEDLPDGAVIRPLSAGDDSAALGRVTGAETDGFTALNTIFWRDGLLLELAPGVVLERPVELYFHNDLAGGEALVPVRNLIRLGAGSEATVLERFAPGSKGLVEHSVTEIECEAGAVVRHVKFVTGDGVGEHFGSTFVRQQEDSRYLSWEILTGSHLARREIHVDLAGNGASCDLEALYLGSNAQRFDLRTRVQHNAPECTTTELYKGILDDESRGVFDGLIRVAADSQQTSAHQTNRNLLLSDEAVVNSIPRLEIYADDVKCSHGSTTGQLSDEQLFYLRTRGFSPAEARAWLTSAFASEVVESLPETAWQAEISAIVARDLEGVAERLGREQS